MAISLKSKDEIKKMRVAGRMAAEVLELIGDHVVPGVSTETLDQICHNHIVKVQKAIPASLSRVQQKHFLNLGLLIPKICYLRIYSLNILIKKCILH